MLLQNLNHDLMSGSRSYRSQGSGMSRGWTRVSTGMISTGIFSVADPSLPYISNHRMVLE